MTNENKIPEQLEQSEQWEKSKQLNTKSKVEREQLKEILNQHLSENEMENSWKKVEEWYLEDQSEGILVEKVIEQFPFLEKIFIELGLL